MTEIKPDYGVDAPNVLRNFFLFGVPCLLLGIFGPHQVHLGKVGFFPKPMFFFTGLCLVLEGLLFLQYVKFGKFRHRDFMLSLHQWRGDEQVLDVGCGRGLLLAGAAKRLGLRPRDFVPVVSEFLSSLCACELAVDSDMVAVHVPVPCLRFLLQF
jgi:hypothetical protein